MRESVRHDLLWGGDMVYSDKQTWIGRMSDQRSRLPLSLRAEGVAISWYNAQISNAVPGDSHGASPLGMTYGADCSENLNLAR